MFSASTFFPAVRFHDPLQRADAAGMTALHDGAAPLSLRHRDVLHFVRDCRGEQDHHVRRTEPPRHVSAGFHIYLRPAPVLSACVDIDPLHTFIAADDRYAHTLLLPGPSGPSCLFCFSRFFFFIVSLLLLFLRFSCSSCFSRCESFPPQPGTRASSAANRSHELAFSNPHP